MSESDKAFYDWVVYKGIDQFVTIPINTKEGRVVRAAFRAGWEAAIENEELRRSG